VQVEEARDGWASAGIDPTRMMSASGGSLVVPGQKGGGSFAQKGYAQKQIKR
jgi:hypothetical protein